MSSLQFWANVSVVILAIEAFIIIALALALSYALVRVMHVVHLKTLTYTRKAQGVSRTVAERSALYSDKVTQPVLKAEAQARRAGRFTQSLFGRKPQP
jgi:hypothetical protein